MKNNEGQLIVIEGSCDGVGKSTQTSLLEERLIKETDRKVIKHHFPTYNSAQAQLVEEYLRGTYGLGEDLSPYLINTLYAVDRAITWLQYLKHEYEAGSYILLDRYTTSSLIYQSALIDDINQKKEFIKYVTDYEYNKLQLKEPDKTIFLYGPYEVFRELRKNRNDNEGIKNDIHESRDDFMRQVYENALFVADYLNWDKVDCTKDGKMDTIDNIHNKVYSLIKK